jgi:hypothetical protein
MGENRTLWTWWACLKAIALFNILLWAVTGMLGGMGIVSWQIALSGVFVIVCAFRSWLPRIDLERYCLVDSPLSGMVVGRAAATVAEVCFAAQIALALNRVGHGAQIPWIVEASYTVVPPLALAQLFCWYSVLTLDHLGHVIEESLWALTMTMVGVCLAVAAGHLDGRQFWFAVAGTAVAAVFVSFMVLVDVPMYFKRWRHARRESHLRLTLRAGLRDARNRRIPTTEWVVWRPELAWLTGYFSIAVWISISVAYLWPR